MFRGFFASAVTAALLLIAGDLPAQSQQELCGFVFRPPAGAEITANDANLFAFRLSYPAAASARTTVDFALACTPNQRRTSALEETLVQSEGVRLQRVERLELDRGVQAAVFSRTHLRQGRSRKRIEAYFATRDFEYRLASEAQNPPADFDFAPVANDILAMLADAEFRGEVRPAISEAAYVWRLRILAIALLALGSVVIGTILVRSLRRRREKRSGGFPEDPKQTRP